MQPRRPSSMLVLGVALGLLLTGVAGEAAAAAPDLALPVRVDFRSSLLQQYGYDPDYELNVPSFDPWNRPFIRSRTVSQHETDHVDTPQGVGWTHLALLAAVKRDYPTFAATVNAGGYVSELIEFDRRGRAYTLLEIRLADGSLKNVLMYSLDCCVSWRTATLPVDGHVAPYSGHDVGTMTVEHFTGWNGGDEPPLIALWRPVSRWPGPRAGRNELYVVAPTFEGDQLRLPPPTLVTRRHLGMTQAAGGASFAATAGSTSFVVWTEVAPAGASGSPTFVASLDRRTGRLGPAVFVGKAEPANDDHDTPSICLDGHGRLHVVIGSHGRRFRYVRSIRPFDARAWTRPKAVLTSGFREKGTDADGRGRQTYVSLVCLPDDTLVLVFRQQRAGVDRAFRGRAYACLSIQTRSPGGPWSRARRLVLRRDRCGYVNYFHKLALDRTGRLFLSLSPCDPNAYPPALRERNRYHRRMVLVSDDGAASWRFATTEDYAAGMAVPGGGVSGGGPTPEAPEAPASVAPASVAPAPE